jgi:lysophospholipid acyltransferase (LPLAT)-like uncharacterized protein
MTLKEIKRNILRNAGNKFLFYAVDVLCKSLRVKIENGEAVQKLIDEKKNFVVAFWHGSMLLGWFLHRGKNSAALVSKSKDGDLLSNVLTKWNFEVARGSSHVGGGEALIILLKSAEDGYTIAITPDGPTGPIYKMKPGAVITAKKAKIPLFLLGIGHNKKRVLKSWDKFEIPKFFSKSVAVYSDPIFIDDNLSYDETNEKIKDCEMLLNKLQMKAEELC